MRIARGIPIEPSEFIETENSDFARGFLIPGVCRRKNTAPNGPQLQSRHVMGFRKSYANPEYPDLQAT